MKNLKSLVLSVVIGLLSISVVAHDNKTELEMTEEKYVPPVMPEYPISYEDIMKTLAPYYQAKRPLDYFFELFVIDTLEQLPSGSIEALTEFSRRHPTFFESSNGDWKQYVKTEFHLSETIEIAVWDLWITNSKNAENEGWAYHPWHYAQNFFYEYTADNSKVDVWGGNALELAKERISRYRSNR